MTQEETPEVQETPLQVVARLAQESDAALDAFDKAEKARTDLKAAQRKEREGMDESHREALSKATSEVTKAAKKRDRAAGLVLTAQRAARATTA